MNTTKRVLIIVSIIVLVAAILMAIPFVIKQVVVEAANQAVSPIKEASNQLKTQVSNLLNPTPTIIPDPVTIIHEVRSMARLETIQYSVEKVITAEMGQGRFGFLFGDRLLFVAHGTVVAGVDLNKITEKDLWLEGSILHVRLPAAEVFVATLDNDKSYVFDRQTGLLTSSNANLETQARQAAEDEILKAALADKILEQAQANAETYLTRLFMTLGYKEVQYAPPSVAN